MENDKYEKYIIETKKIGISKQSLQFLKSTIEEILQELEEKEKIPFGPGDTVATLEGPYAHMGLMVVEKKENGMVRLAPGPNIAVIEIHQSKLWHFNDYHKAFNVALVEEQTYKPDKSH